MPHEPHDIINKAWPSEPMVKPESEDFRKLKEYAVALEHTRADLWRVNEELRQKIGGLERGQEDQASNIEAVSNSLRKALGHNQELRNKILFIEAGQEQLITEKQALASKMSTREIRIRDKKHALENTLSKFNVDIRTMIKEIEMILGDRSP